METITQESTKDVFTRQIKELSQSIPQLQGVMVTAIAKLSITFNSPYAETKVKTITTTTVRISKKINKSSELGNSQEMATQDNKKHLLSYKNTKNSILSAQVPNFTSLGLIHLGIDAPIETSNSLGY